MKNNYRIAILSRRLNAHIGKPCADISDIMRVLGFRNLGTETCANVHYAMQVLGLQNFDVEPNDNRWHWVNKTYHVIVVLSEKKAQTFEVKFI